MSKPSIWPCSSQTVDLVQGAQECAALVPGASWKGADHRSTVSYGGQRILGMVKQGLAIPPDFYYPAIGMNSGEWANTHAIKVFHQDFQPIEWARVVRKRLNIP